MLYCVKGLEESGGELTEVVGMEISTGGAIIVYRGRRGSTEGRVLEVLFAGEMRCLSVFLSACLFSVCRLASDVTVGRSACSLCREALGALEGSDCGSVATIRLRDPGQ